MPSERAARFGSTRSRLRRTAQEVSSEQLSGRTDKPTVFGKPGTTQVLVETGYPRPAVCRRS